MEIAIKILIFQERKLHYVVSIRKYDKFEKKFKNF